MTKERTKEDQIQYLRRKLIQLDMAISGCELAKDILQQQFEFITRQIEKLMKIE